MAVITCRECLQPVSTEAPACPHCGCPTDPKPAKPGLKSGQNSLGNDPRCYVCGRGANRACSQCGQFCCDRHISEPSNQHAALCHPCTKARYQGLSLVGAVVLVLLGAFAAWELYLHYNPPKPIEFDIQQIWDEHFEKELPQPLRK
jgi:hypothetical protein